MAADDERKELRFKSAAETIETPEDERQQLHTKKTNRQLQTARTGAVGGVWTPWGVLGTIGKLGKTQTMTAGYTPGELEHALYDDTIGIESVSRTGLLSVYEIIGLQEEFADDDAVPPGVFRFLTDTRVHIADVLLFLTVFSTALFAPLSFLWDGRWDTPELVPGGKPLLLLDMCLDVVYAGYLLLQLNTSFLHPKMRVEIVNPEDIRQWLKHKPAYWMAWVTCFCYIPVLLGAPLWINNLKIIRAKHIIHPPDSTWRFQDKAFFRIGRPVIMLLAGSHWLACVLYCFGGYRVNFYADGEEAFRTTFDGEDFASGAVSTYLMAFVEALYMLTGALDNPVGDGSPREKQFGALVLVSVFGPVGMFVTALLISVIVREQSMAYALEMRHEEDKAFKTRAMEILNIPAALQQRVFSMHYYQKMGHDTEAFHELFDKKNLSPSLEGALLVYLYRDSVCSSKYFQQKDHNYIIEVLRALQFQVYLPGDYIARRGELADSMYFVSKGELSVLVPSAGSHEIRHAVCVGAMGKGDHFGEIALFANSMRTAWVRADSYALVSALTRSMIEMIWQFFPLEKAELHKMVNDQLENDKKRAVKHHWKHGLNAIKKLGGKYIDTDEEIPDREGRTSFGGRQRPEPLAEAQDRSLLEMGGQASHAMGVSASHFSPTGTNTANLRDMQARGRFSNHLGGPVSGGACPDRMMGMGSQERENTNRSELASCVHALASRMEDLSGGLRTVKDRLSSLERVVTKVAIPEESKDTKTKKGKNKDPPNWTYGKRELETE